MTDFLNRFLETFSTGHESMLYDFIIILVLSTALSFISVYITRKIIFKVGAKIVSLSKNTWDDILFEKKFFRSLSFIIPIVLLRIAEVFLTGSYKQFFSTMVDVYVVFAFTTIINIFIDSANAIYESYEISKNRPIKGLLQAFRIFVIAIAIILVIAIVQNKSISSLLVTLGASTAIIMLIFKDTILGLVAGIQLTTNGMVRIGDWIELKDDSANGTVIDISLLTVTIQNWDKTIASVPAYNLISNTFINWRGMDESGGRRIQRSINIDMDSVHFLTQEEVSELKKSEILSKYIDKMLGGASDGVKKLSVLDKERLTNLGVFRNYLKLWLESNPDIHDDMTMIVRQLQPTATGIPLQIYCFSKKQDWSLYEGVQSDLFDHIISIMPEFGLNIYQFRGTVVSTQD